MRAALLLAAVVIAATACGGDETGDATSTEAASAAASIASAAAGAASSVVADAASAAGAAIESATSAAGAAVESATSPSSAAPAAKPAGERPADNTVRVEVEGKATKVYPTQSCGPIPGLDSWTFAGNVEGGGQLVINMLKEGKGNFTLLGGQVTGTGNFENLVTGSDGTFSGTTNILDTAVSFYGHCDALKK